MLKKKDLFQIAILFFTVLLIISFSFGEEEVFKNEDDVIQDVTVEVNYGPLLEDIKMVKGSNGDLHEDKYLVREELITLICRIYNDELDSFEPPTTPTFADVPIEHWAYKYIEFSFYKGITNGIGDGKFGIGDHVNYNQASLFLSRSLGYDMSHLDYATAAKSISQSIELNTIYDVKPTENIKRLHAFELLAKALMIENYDGKYLIDEMGLATDDVNNFTEKFYNIYDMVIESNLYNGELEIRYSNGDVYFGLGKDGIRHGKGSYFYNNGDFYNGSFLNGEKNGYGIYYFTDGTVYEGMWEEDNFLEVLDNEIDELNQDYDYLNSGFSKKEVKIHELKFVNQNNEPIEGFGIYLTSIPRILTTSSLITDKNGIIYLPLDSTTHYISIGISPIDFYSFSRDYERRYISRNIYKHGLQTIIKVYEK